MRFGRIMSTSTMEPQQLDGMAVTSTLDLVRGIYYACYDTVDMIMTIASIFNSQEKHQSA